MYSVAQELPGCLLTVVEDVGTTTTVKLYSAEGIPVSSEPTLSSGGPVYMWDVLHITCTGGTVTVTGAALMSAGYYRVGGGGDVIVTAKASA